MARKNPDFFNVIKVINIKSLKTMEHFTCVQCINRTKCRHHLKEKENCEVNYRLFNSGVNFKASVEAVMDTQFYITNNPLEKNKLVEIINNFRKCQK